MTINDLRENFKHPSSSSVLYSWYINVAGDQTFPDEKQYTQTNISLDHDFRRRPIDEMPLEPSGLLGPVKIQVSINN